MWENLKNYQTLSICPFLSDFLGQCYFKRVLCKTHDRNDKCSPKLFSGKKEEHSDPNPTLSEVLLIHLHDI